MGEIEPFPNRVEGLILRHAPSLHFQDQDGAVVRPLETGLNGDMKPSSIIWEPERRPPLRGLICRRQESAAVLTPLEVREDGVQRFPLVPVFTGEDVIDVVQLILQRKNSP